MPDISAAVAAVEAMRSPAGSKSPQYQHRPVIRPWPPTSRPSVWTWDWKVSPLPQATAPEGLVREAAEDIDGHPVRITVLDDQQVRAVAD